MGNKPAHLLAQHAKFVTDFEAWVEETPSFLEAAIASDATICNWVFPVNVMKLWFSYQKRKRKRKNVECFPTEEDKIWDKAWRTQQAHVHRPMSTGPKKVEPILCLGPWQNEGPDLPTKFQKTCSIRMRLALQGWDLLCKEKTCSTRKGGRTSLL